MNALKGLRQKAAVQTPEGVRYEVGLFGDPTYTKASEPPESNSPLLPAYVA